MNSVSFFSDMLQTIAERGRRFLSFSLRDEAAPGLTGMEALCETLLSSHGEASGMALAKNVLDRWSRLNDDQRQLFMAMLLDRFGPDTERLEQAIERYRSERTPEALLEIHMAAEPRRQELIRRLNLAPNGIGTLVRMREFLLELKDAHPGLGTVDADFAHLFNSWFNRGFLMLRPISWSTPADILEKIIRYEAVHEIDSWEELRRRLAPEDRRCFAFFHPQLPDDPLIFVEVALMRKMPAAISEVLDGAREPIRAADATTAVFYSISNCQKGLRGVSFGNFLIKQVVEDLRRELPKLEAFVTLSPVPGLADWLTRERKAEILDALNADEKARLAALDDLDWPKQPGAIATIQPAFMAAAAWYFLRARNRHGKPVDPVARFHLGNGARLERLNFLADRSPRAMRQAHGLMVNYLYELDDIETNHEAFAGSGEVVTAPQIRKMLRRNRPGRSVIPFTSSAAESKAGIANKRTGKEFAS
jgi:malonyl-CoA decarboxylase